YEIIAYEIIAYEIIAYEIIAYEIIAYEIIAYENHFTILFIFCQHFFSNFYLQIKIFIVL
ncbi:MAG: hypothetical protein FWF57_02135, partial [Defluviitaleaceae bacterium]|nr:hypothetical protein [Defluviitaleaceae bacterium]